MTVSKDTLSVDDGAEVEISLYNDSDFDGKETVMLFMRDLVASDSRPVQQLIDFKKVQIKAKERKIVKFLIREEQLRFWNNENKFVSEPGEFHISTGYADHLLYTQFVFLK